MTANHLGGGWIHNFAVTETQTHKGGYTIYKITSIVFPRSLPQALTCLTVWKRFHDVKRLHRELQRRHKLLQLPGKLPEPTDCSYFKRFDESVIRARKAYILTLLDFVAQHPPLYKCHAFAQFFSDPQTPNQSPLHRLASLSVENVLGKGDSRDQGAALANGGSLGALTEKREKLDPRSNGNKVLHLQKAPERELEILERTEQFEELQEASAAEEDDVANGTTAGNHGEVKEADEEDPVLGLQKSNIDNNNGNDYKRFLTPMASIESDDSDYIFEAALEFSRAVQAEVDLEYREAYERYKHGVELLQLGIKDDSNDERKFIAKTKISKYTARAQDIYERFLLPAIDGISTGGESSLSNFQLSVDLTVTGKLPADLYLERPWSHLSKYRVVRILHDSVLQVQCVTESTDDAPSIYIMKGIEKPTNKSSTQSIFLPQHVPYMVELVAFFQSEYKIFLLLKQAEGGRLYDYVQSYAPTGERKTHLEGLFPEDVIEGSNAEDIDCALSCLNVQDSGYVEEPDILGLKSSSPTAKTVPSDSSEFTELLRCSQQLLQSVSNTLQEVKQIGREELPPPAAEEGGAGTEPAAENPGVSCSDSTRKMPEASLKQWARELVVAVHCLHTKGVILGDLHMENLLLGAKGQLLLSYFYQHEGLVSENFVHKSPSVLALQGHFVAPERPLTFKSDWWSYGVVLYQLLVGVPFQTFHPGAIDTYFCVQYPEEVDISDCARDLLDNLLFKSPDERLGYEQIKEHEFFKGTHWEEVERNGLNSGLNAAASATHSSSL